ncbi:MAG: CBS domain-containing protein [Proteobacteria bacterium]|nr:CBS domain-containing protein [Pseudomonadota bacterium]
MRGLPLMRIAGIDVTVDWSLLIIFALITTSLASGLFPRWHPAWSAATCWLTALAAAVLFFTSVLAHELSHSLVGRANGIQVKRITLFVFGGMAQMENEPERWPAELWMAIAGPVTSLVIGVLCVLAAGIGASAGAAAQAGSVPALEQLLAGLDPGRTLLLWLGQINIVLAIFNLVPAFPLDGGRVLRAILWGVTRDLRRATRFASALGQGFAWLLIAAGIAMLLGVSLPYFGSGAVNGIWLAFIGWFLNNAALMSYRQLLTRELLQDLPVRRLMLTPLETVWPDMPLDMLVSNFLLRTDQRAFPVMEGERLAGLVCQRDVERIPAAQRHSTSVREVMKPLDQIVVAHPGDHASEVLGLLAQRDINQVLVVEDGRVAGLARRADILRWLALHGSPKSPPG